jgi:N-acetylmuramoyl-L-alanine amidase
MVALPVVAAGGPGPVVVLDPGHGPMHPGAVSARGLPETTFNDRLAAALVAKLGAKEGFTVLLTREPGEELSLAGRVKRIREADPDLVISIHHDSVQPQFLKRWKHGGKRRRYCDRFSGFSLFVPTAGYYAEVSRKAATALADGLLAGEHRFTSHHAMKIPGESRAWVDQARGIHDGGFLYLARHVDRPFVLWEAGVLVHREEESRLSDPARIDETAATAASAIEAFFRGLDRDRREREPTPPHGLDAGIRHPQELPSTPVVRFQAALPGLEVALVPVYFRGDFVDRFVLVRADPARFRLAVHFDRAKKDIAAWRKHLGAPVVINGSFYGKDPVAPTTPVLADGKRLGPRAYRSTHGAFFAEPADDKQDRFAIRDYDDEPVALTTSGYRHAAVSYPMLIDANGANRAAPNPRWRADRSFIGEDRQGRIVLGTTEGGFFSLHRLGRFLKVFPGLGLIHALNLDGGPPACMALQAGEFTYVARGKYVSNDTLGLEIFFGGARDVVWPLPLVIALTPRGEPVGGK